MKEIRLKSELKKLIGFAPVTTDFSSCNELLKYEESVLASAGFEVIRGEINRHPYLLASNGEMHTVDVLLQAHIDVVPADDSMFSLIQEDDKLVGRGVYDMLFAVACFNKLICEESLSSMTVGVMLSSDEEIGGLDGVGQLIKGYKAKVCILPDAGTHEEICTEAKGVLQLTLQIPGVAGHGARPWLTESPVLKLSEVIKEIMAVFPNQDQDDTTCSFTQMHGGSANNQVPSKVEIVLDIRFKPGDNPYQIKDQLEQKLKPHGVVVSIADTIGESYAVDIENTYVKAFIDAHKSVAGNKLGVMRAPGSSDARFITPLGIPVIMTRPEGGGLHGDNEWVSLSSLEQYYEILKTYVLSMRKV